MSKIATDLSTVTTVGLDIAKYVFQVHAIDPELPEQDTNCRNSLPF